ncbi:hemoglobin, alpha embryonic 5 isoform X2 [Ictalurus punctatus]|uniref:Hemoglobin subunit alpha n=1 Tax=Ictalurus punctatus TaxID=7998 RepID=W5U988_ICTPU|nr:hemoglobin, alpha embryonic 5 isoform X2 [Ictalurus punctatus]
MSLSENDKQMVKTLWAKISPAADQLGCEALSRMFLVFPQTKTYFAHWPDLSLGSDSVKKHGKKVMNSVGEAVNNIDDLFGGLSSLSELHAFQLRIDPTNFKILSHNILVVIANRFPDDFSVEAHLSLEKFFARVALAMSDKYR